MPGNTAEDKFVTSPQSTTVPQVVSPVGESGINSIIGPQPKKGKSRVWLALGVITVLSALGAGTYLVQRQSFNQSYAWNCTQYVFNVGQDGIVTADNNSTRNEPAQSAQVYINDTLVATLTVPALTSGANATLGSVEVPVDAGFTWLVEGSLDCEDNGSYTVDNSPTPTLTVTPTISVTLTPTVTTSVSPSVSPTVSPTISVTATPSPTGSVSPTVSPTNPPTPTTINGSAQGTGDALADAGISLPTILGLTLGILLIAGALILAI